MDAVYRDEVSSIFLPQGLSGSFRVPACGLRSGTEFGAPWFQLSCSGGQDKARGPRWTDMQTHYHLLHTFWSLTSLVKRSFHLDLSVENFLVIRRSHRQGCMWNSISRPYLEPNPGIYNRPFPNEIPLKSMGIFLSAPSLLLLPEPPLWSGTDLRDKIKW